MLCEMLMLMEQVTRQNDTLPVYLL